jgi:hypothetical protein
MTCDPNRAEGARSNRLEEFPAEDVFLEQELLPDVKGFYQVPASGGQRCIGLVWPEKRVLNTLTLEFKDSEAIPSPEKVKVQYWSSKNRELDDVQGAKDIFRSAWQGMWRPLPGRMRKEGSRLVFRIAEDQTPEFLYQRGTPGTGKIRWIWPSSDGPSAVRRPLAQSRNSSAVHKDYETKPERRRITQAAISSQPR